MIVIVVPEQSVLAHNKRYGLRLVKRIGESAKMEVYYAGFNGFKQVQNPSKSRRNKSESTMVQAVYNCHDSKSQVPGSSGSDTLTCLTLHSKAPKVIDAAICWNYMVTTAIKFTGVFYVLWIGIDISFGGGC